MLFYWPLVERLIQCSPMADWRQIQARIRKAKTSVNPSAKLSELYQRTRDAMVAWELGTFEEKNGRADEAAKWYATAAQRFRRAEWKKKAEEALARLGVEVPVSSAEPVPSDSEDATDDAEDATQSQEGPERAIHYEPHMLLAPGEIPEALAPGEIIEKQGSPDAQTSARLEPPENTGTPVQAHKRRRRGRRGGRGRRRDVGSPSLPTQAFANSRTAVEEPDSKPHVSDAVAHPVPSAQAPARERREEEPNRERIQARSAGQEQVEPQPPSERAARGRAGDPALASRMAHLESMLRRLLSSPLRRLDELEDAPAGPGVFLLSDSDQVTSYYVESCQTLRIGLGNLTRGSRGGSRGHHGGGRGTEIDLKEKLADHLGINQSKVTQYMKDHCIVRWIQLDEDAPHLAHFAIGVLRTPLNLD